MGKNRRFYPNPIKNPSKLFFNISFEFFKLEDFLQSHDSHLLQIRKQNIMTIHRSITFFSFTKKVRTLTFILDI